MSSTGTILSMAQVSCKMNPSKSYTFCLGMERPAYLTVLATLFQALLSLVSMQEPVIYLLVHGALESLFWTAFSGSVPGQAYLFEGRGCRGYPYSPGKFDADLL